MPRGPHASEYMIEEKDHAHGLAHVHRSIEQIGIKLVTHLFHEAFKLREPQEPHRAQDAECPRSTRESEARGVRPNNDGNPIVPNDGQVKNEPRLNIILHRERYAQDLFCTALCAREKLTAINGSLNGDPDVSRVPH